MSPKQIILANPTIKKDIPGNTPFYLSVSEFFSDTIQGEGINMGQPAAFLRLQFCTLNCDFCDTQEVWRYGNPYTFDELFLLMEENDLIDKLHDGKQHLVITGGSPLKQQFQLVNFCEKFLDRYGFWPYTEIENECTLYPTERLLPYIACWNNSPKLSSSGNHTPQRYKPNVLQKLASLPNSWFKFVIANEKDCKEVMADFVLPDYIGIHQVIFMPLGGTREELERNRELVVELAIKYGVRYCTREHIVIWDKKTGI